MKCSKCGVDGAQQNGYCKPCRSEYNREWYRKNSARHREQVNRNRSGYEARNRAIIEAAKSVPCMDCGGSFETCQMDFDHLGDKSYNVASMLSHSEKMLRKEISNCDVVCANCHRLRTKNRLSTGAAS